MKKKLLAIIYNLLAHSSKNQQNKYPVSNKNHRVLMKKQQTNENRIKKQNLFPLNYSTQDTPTFPQQYPENLSFAFCATELLWNADSLYIHRTYWRHLPDGNQSDIENLEKVDCFLLLKFNGNSIYFHRIYWISFIQDDSDSVHIK